VDTGEEELRKVVCLVLLRGCSGKRREFIDAGQDQDWSASWLEEVSADLESSQLNKAKLDICSWAKQGIGVLACGTVLYPPQLSSHHERPLILFYRGQINILDFERCIAMIGSRKADSAACNFAFRCGQEAARIGLSVVSGLALGIDGAAHLGVVANTSDAQLAPPIAILGHGLDRVYPASHRSLARRIIECGGALLSEFEPGVSPLPHHFLQRNQIIAGLSKVIVVLAASKRSGSLNTVRYALEMGRDVYAVPGSVFDEGMRGCNQLIQNGAGVLLSPEEIQELGLKTMTQQKVAPQGCHAEVSAYLGGRGPVLLDEFKQKFSHLGDLDLLELEMRGVVEMGSGYVQLKG
jgi:DNA processing protein